MLTVCKASAGSGKTFALALVYIQLLLEGLDKHHEQDPYRHILAVTFTKKATAEMKQRIIKELHTIATRPEESKYIDYLLGIKSLDDEGQTVHRRPTDIEKQKETAVLSEKCKTLLGNMLQDYPLFQVSTIDSFFQQVIRAFARELHLRADYDVSLDSDQILDEGIDRLFFDATQGDGSEETYEDILRYAENNIESGASWNPKQQLRTFANELTKEKVQKHKEDLMQILEDKSVVTELQSVLKTKRDEIWSQEHTKSKNPKPNVLRAGAPKDKQHDFNSILIYTKHLKDLSMLTKMEQKIDEKNREEHRIPISETNLLLRKITGDATAPFVYEKVGTRLRHYLLDEFQDTSRLQWENFVPLLEESISNSNENLIVGDVKQSIYRWRNSDLEILQNIDKQGLDIGKELPKRFNFRSAPAIVNANNILFKRYAEKLTEQGLAPTATEAYKDAEQEADRNDLQGIYHIEWHDKKGSEFVNLAMQRTLEVINECLKTGRVRQRCEIAILVRKNKEASKLSEFLTSNGIPVQSPEGLLIESHDAVKLLVAELRIMTNNDDSISHYTIKRILSGIPSEKREELHKQAQQLMLRSDFFLLVRGLIDIFKLQEMSDAEAYITTFLDVVYDFSTRHSADISSFLDYWDRKHSSICIPASQDPNAVQIMTIHKSKGLQFPMVIVPFVNWGLGQNRQSYSDLLWCETQDFPEPFNRLPIMPTQCTSTAATSVFAADAKHEVEALHIDALNTTYVAFTRPEHTFYAFAPMNDTKTAGTWIYKTIKEEPCESQHFTENDDYAVWETQDTSNNRTEEAVTLSAPVTLPLHYVSEYPGNRLTQRTRTTESLTEDDNEQRLFGTMMHELLETANTREDAERELQRRIDNGIFREDMKKHAQQTLRNLFELIAREGHSDWFENRYLVLKETAILTPHNNLYRPDRVMFDGQKAVVVDYKFGKEEESHIKQVKDYVSQLGQMGYDAKGYLIYAIKQKIVRAE